MAKEQAAATAATAPAKATETAEVKEVKEELKTYYGGLVEKCPLDYITIPTLPGEGAITLQKWTQKLVSGAGDGIFQLSAQMPGGLVRLFEDERKAMMDYINSHFILWENRGENRRVSIIPKEGPGAKRSRREDWAGNVEPLARYVWLVPAERVNIADREANYLPKTMEEEAAPMPTAAPK